MNTKEEDAEQNREKDLQSKSHVEIYSNASILVGDDNIIKSIWFEGKQSSEAQERYRRITNAFSQGFLDEKIEAAKSARIGPVFGSNLSQAHKKALDEVVSSVTAQRGRALVEILVLQLAIKAICPEQDVRLHKGSRGSEDTADRKGNRRKKSATIISSANNEDSELRSKFSWREGISMRRLDDTFLVPILRKHGLIRMNEYGAFMTRSFAENYPYTFFYKAEISGAKRHWLELIDELEEKKLDPDAALLYVLDLLWKTSEQFKSLAEKTLKELQNWIDNNPYPSIKAVTRIIKQHIDKSEARARLLEVAMHSLLQALEDLSIDLGGKLKPLMPMRTANQKHRNYGDVEVVYGDFVAESWDAKFDNPYLSDALDVFIEKIRGKDVSELTFGYVLLPEKKNTKMWNVKLQLLLTNTVLR